MESHGRAGAGWAATTFFDSARLSEVCLTGLDVADQVCKVLGCPDQMLCVGMFPLILAVLGILVPPYYIHNLC